MNKYYSSLYLKGCFSTHYWDTSNPIQGVVGIPLQNLSASRIILQQITASGARYLDLGESKLFFSTDYDGTEQASRWAVFYANRDHLTGINLNTGVQDGGPLKTLGLTLATEIPILAKGRIVTSGGKMTPIWYGCSRDPSVVFISESTANTSQNDIIIAIPYSYIENEPFGLENCYLELFDPDCGIVDTPYKQFSYNLNDQNVPINYLGESGSRYYVIFRDGEYSVSYDLSKYDVYNVYRAPNTFFDEQGVERCVLSIDDNYRPRHHINLRLCDVYSATAYNSRLLNAAFVGEKFMLTGRDFSLPVSVLENYSEDLSSGYQLKIVVPKALYSGKIINDTNVIKPLIEMSREDRIDQMFGVSGNPPLHDFWEPIHLLESTHSRVLESTSSQIMHNFYTVEDYVNVFGFTEVFHMLSYPIQHVSTPISPQPIPPVFGETAKAFLYYADGPNTGQRIVGGEDMVTISDKVAVFDLDDLSLPDGTLINVEYTSTAESIIHLVLPGVNRFIPRSMEDYILFKYVDNGTNKQWVNVCNDAHLYASHIAINGKEYVYFLPEHNSTPFVVCFGELVKNFETTWDTSNPCITELYLTPNRVFCDGLSFLRMTYEEFYDNRIGFMGELQYGTLTGDQFTLLGTCNRLMSDERHIDCMESHGKNINNNTRLRYIPSTVLLGTGWELYSVEISYAYEQGYESSKFSSFLIDKNIKNYSIESYNLDSLQHPTNTELDDRYLHHRVERVSINGGTDVLLDFDNSPDGIISIPLSNEMLYDTGHLEFDFKVPVDNVGRVSKMQFIFRNTLSELCTDDFIKIAYPIESTYPIVHLGNVRLMQPKQAQHLSQRDYILTNYVGENNWIKTGIAFKAISDPASGGTVDVTLQQRLRVINSFCYWYNGEDLWKTLVTQPLLPSITSPLPAYRARTDDSEEGITLPNMGPENVIDAEETPYFARYTTGTDPVYWEAFVDLPEGYGLGSVVLHVYHDTTVGIVFDDIYVEFYDEFNRLVAVHYIDTMARYGTRTITRFYVPDSEGNQTDAYFNYVRASRVRIVNRNPNPENSGLGLCYVYFHAEESDYTKLNYDYLYDYGVCVQDRRLVGSEDDLTPPPPSGTTHIAKYYNIHPNVFNMLEQLEFSGVVDNALIQSNIEQSSTS